MDKLGSSDFGTPKNSLKGVVNKNEKSKFSNFVQDSGSDSPSESSK